MIKEKQIEDNFIRKLIDLKYIYRNDICERETLEQNFREKFQRLNHVHLTDSEFARLLDEITDSDIFASARRLRERNTFIREDGTPLQYTLVNIKEWCKNEYEVINQFRINTRNSFQRYDVIILINGLPIVQIELKSLQVSPRRAMQQIVDYKNDRGNGYANSLLCFIQLFVVSNQSNTYYFANNNNTHFAFNADEQYLPVYQWADEGNSKISYLYDFCDAVLAKCQLGKMISRYMVLIASEQKILIMRPYQIYAVEAIMKCIEENRGNGYIWHTTGSGKTLTSFKAATLLKDNQDVEKCLFVVDRKDLDRQTREEFNRFQDGCVEENTNTDALVRRMLSEDYADKIIVTTIQKLGIALDPKNRNHYRERLLLLKDKRIVFIFDECHRSQFGDNHKAIKEFFPNSQLFGFTGTPIFEENASYIQVTGEVAQNRTTVDVFQKELHRYTITNAIDDDNVLRFHVDYFKPDSTMALADERARKRAVAEAIIRKHWVATDNCRFNALFATASINDAIEYYHLLQEVQDRTLQDDGMEPLNITCVFSPPAQGNSDIMQMQEDLEQERKDNEVEPDRKKRELAAIIDQYNSQYGTAHTVTDFDRYYQDVQLRIKNQKYSNKDYPHSNKIDIVIVVDMLLTGFDSKYLNTLYVDKNLKYHHLIQAFSRTNRILNHTKPYGNILDFREQCAAVDGAVKRFSGLESEDAARRIWLVEPAESIRRKYNEAVANLKEFMVSHNLPFEASAVSNLRGDDAKAGFINCFKQLQQLRTKLDQYTDFVVADSGDTIASDVQADYGFSDDDMRAFRGAYLDLASRLDKRRGQRSGNVSTEIDNLDFEFVLFASALIDYDYIVKLLASNSNKPVAVRMTTQEIISLISSNSNLIDGSDDFIEYVRSIDGVNGMTEQEIKDGLERFKADKRLRELTVIAERHGIDVSALDVFVRNIIDRKIFDGEKLNGLVEPLGLGWKDRTKKEIAIMTDLVPLLKHMADGQTISGLSAYETDM